MERSFSLSSTFCPASPCSQFSQETTEDHFALCLTILLIQRLRSSLRDEAGAERKSWAVNPLDAFKRTAVEEEGAQRDHSASEHPSTLIIISGMLFMMLKAKHRLIC